MRFRFGAFLGVCASGALIALGASNCAAPTQIIIDVRAELSLCKGPKQIQGTGIAVTTPDRIETDPLEVFEGPGCDEDPPGDSIGRLTITPSGDNDAEVSVRIVAGITKPAHQCRGPEWEGCILARRAHRFSPNKTVTITVILSEECIGKGCGKDECEKGACIKPEQILDDGGIIEPKDTGTDTKVPEEDAAPDGPIPILDSGLDACVNCSLPGMTCTGGKACTVDCNVANCTNRTVCGEGLDCTIDCKAVNTCTGTRCAGASACSFNCLGGTGAAAQTHCSKIACASRTCTVTCQDTLNACDGVFLDGGTNDIKCISADKATCDDVHCRGSVASSCKRTCGANVTACGRLSSCTPLAACTNWADGGDGGDGG